METYPEFDPQVGEIRALRTFRIGPDGTLYPLFSELPWSRDTNTASCRLATADSAGSDDLAGPTDQTSSHAAPEAGCTCGYYAYASEHAALEYPHARHVLAVVSCWGYVVAGTRGIRAQHARVDALWISGVVPEDLADRVGTAYPETVIYRDKRTMLAQHPLTVLDCFESDMYRRSTHHIRLSRVVIAVALVVGVWPESWLTAIPYARVAWAILLGAFLLGAAALHRRSPDSPTQRQSLLFLAVALWLLSPLAGAAGMLLLRLPLLQIAVLVAHQRRRIAREASTFPSRIGQPSR